MATLPNKRHSTDGQTLADNYGQIYTYKGQLNQWVNTGADLSADIVSYINDGLITPQIVQSLIQVADAKEAGLLAGAKILPNPNAYYYLMRSQGFLNIQPQTDKTILIEVDANRLAYHLFGRNYCRGPKGPTGEQGDPGTNGTPGPSEQQLAPTIVGDRLTIEMPVETPLNTQIAVRLIRGTAILITVRYALDGTISYEYADDNLTLDETRTNITFINGILNASLFRAAPWEQDWQFKARQMGPQGDKGTDGVGFITIRSSAVADSKIRFPSALRAVRNTQQNYDIHTITSKLENNSPSSHLRVNPNAEQIDFTAGIQDLDQASPDLWGSVEPTSDTAKAITRWGLSSAVTADTDLDLPHWTPMKVCGYGGWTGFDKADEIKCCQEDLFLCDQKQYDCGAEPTPTTNPTSPTEPVPTSCNIGSYSFSFFGSEPAYGQGGVNYVNYGPVGTLNLSGLRDKDLVVFNGSSDDWAFLLGPTDTIIETDQGGGPRIFTIPSNYILFRDTSGCFVSFGVAISKTIRVGINGPSYTKLAATSSGDNSGHVIEMEPFGFETRVWGAGISKADLKARGWVDSNDILKFRPAHIIGGLGFINITGTDCRFT